MTLHVNSAGDVAPLVMLHGWGMHGGIWGGAAERLAQHFRVHCADLPGHGRSESGRERLDAIVSVLAAHFAGPVNICGWSLGGQVALRWAQLHPQQVKKLVLVASTPCFVQRADWRCAIANEVLQGFANALEQNYPLALKRFIALQVRGSENERALLQEMRERMADSGEPDRAALRGGLEILRDTDLRGELAQIAQPALVIAGERDTLTPPAASACLAQTLPNARMVEIRGAAHALFLSHPEEFVKQITDFIG
ncbi:MAG: pimeloyl-ACP methyl ester esterase BioH [Nitrosomonadales bacterium]|nr:pimeloyl-ACP methyl ester esterase BioH [Nitrosomonadales bacterium]